MSDERQQFLNPWLLRLAVFCCFVGHGTLAIKNSNIYYSEWSQWVQSLFPENEKYADSQMILGAVGSIDLLVGLSFLLPTIPMPAFIWAIGWGAATAISRMYFLGALSAPIWQNVLYPISQFLVRTPNWLVPMLLLAHSYKSVPLLGKIADRSSYHIEIAMLAQVLALAIMYLADYNHELYPYEVQKMGMPLGLFHTTGLIAISGFIALSVALTGTKSRLWTFAAGILVPIAFILSEGFEITVLNAPQGVRYTGIRVLEHVPIYICMFYFVRTAIHSSLSVWANMSKASI